jgi:hypothetical protein
MHATATTAIAAVTRSQRGIPDSARPEGGGTGLAGTGAPQAPQNFWLGARSGDPHFPQKRWTMIVPIMVLMDD